MDTEQMRIEALTGALADAGLHLRHPIFPDREKVQEKAEKVLQTVLAGEVTGRAAEDMLGHALADAEHRLRVELHLVGRAQDRADEVLVAMLDQRGQFDPAQGSIDWCDAEGKCIFGRTLEELEDVGHHDVAERWHEVIFGRSIDVYRESDGPATVIDTTFEGGGQEILIRLRDLPKDGGYPAPTPTVQYAVVQLHQALVASRTKFDGMIQSSGLKLPAEADGS